LILRLGLALGLAAGTMGAPTIAVAQSPGTQVEDMIAEAENQYGNLELQAAEATLEEAIETGRRQNVSDATVARAYVMLGVVRYGSTRSKDKAREAFREAAKLDRAVSIPSAYKTPTLASLMETIKQDLPEPSTGGGGDDGGPRRVDSFTHDTITSAQAGESLEVEAFVPSDMPVARVYMLFKRYDQSEYQQQVELEPTDATRFAATIEGYRIYTSQISYYLEAVDQSGNVVARSGSTSSPHSITVLGSSDFDAEKARKMAERKRGGDQTKRDDEETSEQDDESDEESSDTTIDEVAYLSLGVGTGVGFLPGGTPTANPTSTDRINPGLAPAFAHLLLDGGWMITPSSHLGLYWRWQVSPSQDFDAIRARHPDRTSQYTGLKNGECLGTGLPGDCTLGLKYRWFFSQTTDIEFFSSIGAGIGRHRHWLRLRQRESSAFCQNSDKEIINRSNGPSFCYRRDTVRPGWLHVGVGTGFVWHVSDIVSIYGESYLQILFPDTALNLDFNVGPMFRF
jgi:hypothetical protein